MKNFFKSTVFLAIVACLLWASAFAGSKIAMKYMPPLQLAGIRFFISGVALFLFFGNFSRYFAMLKANWRFVIWVAFLQTFLMYSFFYTGLNLVPGAVGAMVIGSGPLFAALVAHFFLPDDRLSWKLGIGMLLGVAGIVIINYGRQSTGIAGTKELLGILILILNNLTGGAYNLVILKSKHQIHPVALSSMSLTIGGLMLFLFSLPFEPLVIKPFPLEFWLALAWLSLLAAVAFAIWFSLLKRPGLKFLH